MTILWNIIPRSCSMCVPYGAITQHDLLIFPSGWSTISPGGENIVVSNLFDGLDFYSITGRDLSHSVPCPINQQKNSPVPVLFSGNGSTIIVGGTSGSVRVLDSSSCETLQILPHDGQLFDFSQHFLAPDYVCRRSYPGDCAYT